MLVRLPRAPVTVLCVLGRPERSRTQWRLVHPRAHTDVTPEVARRLGHLLLRRSLRRAALPLHLPGRALARRATRARGPIVHYHVPTCRHHALDETGRQRVHPRAFPWAHFLVQGRGVAAPRKSIRIFPGEEKCAEIGCGKAGILDGRGCYQRRYGKVRPSYVSLFI